MSKKTDTHQEKDDIRKDNKGFVSTKISDTSFFRTTPFPISSTLYGKNLKLPFWENFKKSNLPFTKGGGGSNNAHTQVVLHHSVKKTSLAWL